MICNYCRYAGGQTAPALVKVAHDQCPGGTHCDCQHKYPSEKFINQRLVDLERPQLSSDDAAARGLGAT